MFNSKEQSTPPFLTTAATAANDCCRLSTFATTKVVDPHRNLNPKITFTNTNILYFRFTFYFTKGYRSDFIFINNFSFIWIKKLTYYYRYFRFIHSLIFSIFLFTASHLCRFPVPLSLVHPPHPLDLRFRAMVS